MKKKKQGTPVTPVEIEQDSPPVAAIEALRRNLLYTMLNAVGDYDMEKIVEAQVNKAKNGDSKAAKLLIDMIQAGGSLQPRQTTTHMQQAVVVNGDHAKSAQFMSDLRRQLVIVLATQGPQESLVLADVVHTPLPRLLEALDSHPWFEKEGGRWAVTEQGRLEVPTVLPKDTEIGVSNE